MKKSICAVLSAAILTSAFTFGGFSVYAAETDYRYGDVNLDGTIDVDDVTLIQKAVALIENFNDTQSLVADVNRDGEVTVTDATCVQRYIAGMSNGKGKTGEKLSSVTKHRLVKSVAAYERDYATDKLELTETTSLEYKNAYPVLIKTEPVDEDFETSETYFDYTFEGSLPKTCKITNNTSGDVKNIEYNKGRVYNIKYDFESGSSAKDYYQYSDDSEFFTSMLREEYVPANEFFPAQLQEEADSVLLVIENGLIKKSVNSGYYANWTEKTEKVWQRFNGTYTAEYDSDGIASVMSAVFRNGPSGVQKKIEVCKENGVITSATVYQPAGDKGEFIAVKKFEFEYADTEISAARYSQMMNYFIIGSGSNYYNNNWY